MDEATRERWCPLHLRTAMGETLNAEEQAFYDSQMRQLDVEEEQMLSGSKEILLRTRQKNEEMKAEYIRLSRQIEEMERQIALAEERLATPVKQMLGVGS